MKNTPQEILDKITFADNLVLCEDYLVPPVFVPMK